MPRRPKLVTQFLERIHRDAFDDHPELIRSLVDDRNGIYALYRKDRLYYVGLAKDLRWRLKHHLKDRHADSWDRFSVYLTIGDQHLRELESLAIRITKADGNRQIGRIAGAENLAKQFERSLADKYRREADRLMGKLIAVTLEPNSIRKTIKLRGWHKGHLYKARLKHDGTVQIRGGKLHSSLSSSAKSICGHSVNGRRFWHYERSPGDWVKVRKLLGKRGE
jgi:hypothetical protein